MPKKTISPSVNTKQRKLRRGKIRVCPVCKKPTLRTADSISGWMTADSFACDNCGYRGPVSLEVEAEDLYKLQERTAEE